MEVFNFGLVMKMSSVSCTQRSTYFQILYYALERWTRTPNQINAWEDRLTWFKSSPEYRAFDKIDGEPMEIRVKISSQDSPRCSSATKFKSYCWDWVKHQRILQYGLSSCRCSTTSHGDLKTMKKNANQVLSSFLSVRKDFHKDNGFFFGLGSEKKWYSTHEYIPQGEWDRGAEQMMLTFCRKQTPNLPIHESIVQRSAQEQRWCKNCQYTSVPMVRRLKLFFAQLFL